MIALTIFMAISGALMLGCVFMMIRNQWVFKARMAYHAECFGGPPGYWHANGCPRPDDLCASYDEMMWKFWIWDREKFRIRRLPSHA